MLYLTPPPVFKYDVADMNDLNRRISMWEDRLKIPEIELDQVICGQNAVYSLPDALSSLGITSEHEVLLVMDDVKMARGDDEVKTLVIRLLEESGFNFTKLILEGDEYGLVHPDSETMDQVIPHLHKDCAVLIVGSGTVTDVVKHSCYVWQHENECDHLLPMVSLMTAASVPAYTSGLSIISKDGVKRTWPSRLPNIVIMDYVILRDCPRTFNIAGVGDMFPLFCAYFDWYLADAMGMGSFLDGSWRIMDDVKDLLIPYSEKMAEGDLTGIEVQSKCLALNGLCMTYAHDSVPMSGYEHVMSHMLDMSAPADKRKNGLHGQQVGVSLLWSMTQLEMLVDYLDKNADSVDIEACYPDEEILHKQVLEAFHDLDPSDAMGEECWNDVQIKLKGWQGARPKWETFLKNWQEHKAALSELRPYGVEECAKALALSTHPLLPEEMEVPIGEERMRWAFKNARLMRKRLTSGDLVGFLGLYDDQWENAVIDRVKAAVAAARS